MCLRVKITNSQIVIILCTILALLFKMTPPPPTAPEVVVRDTVSHGADVWGVGTLAFLLLSGVPAYRASSSESTLVNIALNRYDAADLYENVTTEGLKFLYKVMKRLPRYCSCHCIYFRTIVFLDLSM